jgi:hypothetical protein
MYPGQQRYAQQMQQHLNPSLAMAGPSSSMITSAAVSTKPGYNNDALYTPQMAKTIVDFCNLCNGDMPIARLANIMSTLMNSAILNTLANDPSNVQMQSCVRRVLDTEVNLPRDFLHKFLAVCNARMSLNGSQLNFGNPQYTATVIAGRLEPHSRVNVMTANLNRDQLRKDIATAQTVPRANRPSPYTVRVVSTHDVVCQLVNTTGDIDQYIEVANRNNGFLVAGAIPTKYTRLKAPVRRKPGGL